MVRGQNQNDSKESKLEVAGLVIKFKNCCLKRYENCGLKIVVEKCVFSVYKTKNVSNIMFK